MSTVTRAMFRTVGQLALVLALSEALVSNGDHLYRCLRGDELSPLWCASLSDPHVLPFTLLSFTATVLAAVGWWATLRHGRHWAWVAQGCAVLLAAPGLVWLVRGLFVAHDTASSPWEMGVWVWTIGSLVRVVPLVLLVLSYRGLPLEADEAHVFDWIPIVLAPLVLLGLVYRMVDAVVDLPPLLPLAQALVVGALYGMMRRRRRLCSAGRWLPATLILTALLVPEYNFLRWISPTDDWVPGQLTRNTIAWALATVTVVVLTALQLATTRHNHPRTGPRAGRGGQPIDHTCFPPPQPLPIRDTTDRSGHTQ